jgi:hypothetical protein
MLTSEAESRKSGVRKLRQAAALGRLPKFSAKPFSHPNILLSITRQLVEY